MLECQRILKTKGLNHTTLAECQPYIQAIPSADLRCHFQDYLQKQHEIGIALGLGAIGLPISSDPIESLFGLAKRHGVGEIKDADRIAVRLPALCGIPTRAEAEQVLDISVAEQTEFTSHITSLIKQRRDVLTKSEPLESLGAVLSSGHARIFRVPKRSQKSQKT